MGGFCFVKSLCLIAAQRDTVSIYIMHSITQFLSATHQPPHNLFKCIHFSFMEMSPQWKPPPDQSLGFPCQCVKVGDLHLRAIRLQGHIWHLSPLLQIWAEGLTPFSLVEWGMKNAWFILNSHSFPVMPLIKYLTNPCAAQPRGDCQSCFLVFNYLFICVVPLVNQSVQNY